MAVVLALAAAASWGTSDFLGGLAGRRSTRDAFVPIALASQLIGFVGLSSAALVVGGTLSPADLRLSLVAGVAGSAAVTFLYRGLAVGKMGVVAPVTGALAAALPACIGSLLGERLRPTTWLGVGLALVAIIMVSREPAVPGGTVRTGPRGVRAWAATPGLVDAVLAGSGFAAIFVLLDRTSAASGLLPFVPMKLVATALLIAAALVTGAGVTVERAVLPLVLAVGVLDNLANIAYLLASRVGLLAVVAVISSLYPAGTVLWARFVLHERLVRHQVAGFGLALVAVVLIAVG